MVRINRRSSIYSTLRFVMLLSRRLYSRIRTSCLSYDIPRLFARTNLMWKSTNFRVSSFRKRMFLGISRHVDMDCLRSRQLRLLIWKNFLLQRRSLKMLIFEILIHILCMLLLIFVNRSSTIEKPSNQTYYNSYDLNDKYVPYFKPKLMYAPNGTLSTKIMNEVRKKLSFNFSDVKSYSSEEQLNSAARHFSTSSSDAKMMDVALIGVIFNIEKSTLTLPKNIKYTIRIMSMKLQNYWHVTLTHPTEMNTRPSSEYEETAPYRSKLFLTMQYLIDQTIIRLGSPSPGPNTEVRMMKMPYPPYLYSSASSILLAMLPFILIIGFLPHMTSIVNKIVMEKESKLKETMKMMGMPSFLHWTAWFLNYFIVMIIVAVIYVFFLNFSQLLPLANGAILFALFLLWVMATIFSCFAFSVFFDKAVNSVICAFLLIFLPAIILVGYITGNYDNFSTCLKILSCLLPNVAFALGLRQILLLETSGTGVQWEYFTKPTTLPRDINLVCIFVMLLLDCVLYMFIAWYKDAVAPGEFGIPQPWNFLFMKSYWQGSQVERQRSKRPCNLRASGFNILEFLRQKFCRNWQAKVDANRSSRYGSQYQLVPPLHADGNWSDGSVSSLTEEEEVTGKVRSISLKKLTKKFGSGSSAKVAVDNVNLDVFEGEITTLLGHNGAGKTTTMSIIAGFLPPTSGTAIVSGLDIRTDMNAIRQKLGLCPQHDVLFDSLTVREHMYFFAKLKGCSGPSLESEIDRMLEATHLTAKKNSQSHTLSGGMKRRLSVALALVGGSKIVILDEPSSGLDPESRRELWTFLQAERKDRTMLLSTHLMDEADNLSDRIAIMASGKIQCVGTPLFLKSRYGTGYHLTMVKGPTCDASLVIGFIQQIIPEAKVESDAGQELKVLLPTESRSTFESLFSQLERKKEEIGIESYGVSITTMEEVFFKVGEVAHGEDHTDFDENPESPSVIIDMPGSGAEYLILREGYDLLRHQLRGLWIKRFRYAKRDIKLFALLLPLLTTLFALLIMPRQGETSKSAPLLPLTVGFDDRYFPQTVSYGFDFTGKLPKFATDLMDNYSASFKSARVSNVVKINSTPSMSKFQDALWRAGAKDVGKYNREYLVGAFFQENSSAPSKLTTYAFHSGKDYHSTAISLNHISNALLETRSPGHHITVVNHPFPYNETTWTTSTSSEFFTPWMIVVGLLVLVSTITSVTVEERVSKTKLLHFVSGASPSTYWLTNFAWDYLVYIIACVPSLAFVALYQAENFKSAEQIGGCVALLVLHGWAIIPFVYLVSYRFKSPSSALGLTSTVNIIIVCLTLLFVINMEHLNKHSAAAWIFTVFLPNFCVGNGLRNLLRNHANLKACNNPVIIESCSKLKPVGTGGSCCLDRCTSNCRPWNPNYFGWEQPGIARELAFLALQGLVYIALCVLSDMAVWEKFRSFLSPSRRLAAAVMRQKEEEDAKMELCSMTEDADVARERQKVMLGSCCHNKDVSLCLKDLTHYYGSHCAVDKLTCHVESGQCFGLLGVNGAGKTTTFRMLTGDLGINGGDAFVHGKSIRQSLNHVYGTIGYCPQFSAHVDNLTGREMLCLYGRLRGIGERDLQEAVDDIIIKVMLSKYADKRAATYSGGNKRKLSTGIALIGNPKLVFLDEPTTGVDPEARRHLWNTLSNYRAGGRTLILTSHSMEECEALCTQVAIMVNGRFKCFGSIQHLKAKFGGGYTLFAQVPFSSEAPPEDDKVQRFKKFVEDNFPSAEVQDEHQGLLHYQLRSGAEMTWSRVFGLMERNREELCLENYSVSQTTLEQIFIQFARSQREEENVSDWLTAIRHCMGCRQQGRQQNARDSVRA